jgi:hypothetical protein
MEKVHSAVSSSGRSSLSTFSKCAAGMWLTTSHPLGRFAQMQPAIVQRFGDFFLVRISQRVVNAFVMVCFVEPPEVG